INDTVLAKRINNSLGKLMGHKNIINDVPAFMGSEDFTILASGNKNTKCDYIFIGTAEKGLVKEAIAKGKKTPFTNHNGNYVVDLSSIPLGTVVGTVCLFEMFKPNQSLN